MKQSSFQRCTGAASICRRIHSGLISNPHCQSSHRKFSSSVETTPLSTSITQQSSFSLSSSSLSPFCRYLSPDRHVGIVGAPFAGGQPLIGVDLGPNFIRQGDLINRLKADEWTVVDTGDIDIPNEHQLINSSNRGTESDSELVRHSLIVGGVNQNLYSAASSVLQQQQFLLTLGGDHSIGIGSISAVLKHRPDTGIVWIDAHADINTPATSISHNPHGMVLSFLLDLSQTRSTTTGFTWMNTEKIPILHPSRLVYIGLRDLDKGERQIIKSLNIKAFTMHDVDKYGIGKVMLRAIDHLIHYSARPIHLSLDIDSIDPAFAPSTGTRVQGGLNYREAYYVCEALAETGLLCSMDMVEVNPSLEGEEDSQRTVAMAVGLIASAMGNKIL